MSTLVVIHSLLEMKVGKTGYKKVKRERKEVETIFRELGPRTVRKAYRMHGESFWRLHKILFKNDNVKKRKRGKTPNGPILNSSQLSMALRWMAGGSMYDIASNHGVGVNEVLDSVWKVVDLVNKSDGLKIKFPSNHLEQQQIAEGFQKKSHPSFGKCVGCIDGC